ncbi:MAG TPA: amidohydrolase family protein [Thermodesulfobacteriota bacterium]|nr:amidohydrolase family protein [Thermodesulfobacteriota bacterium]
MKRSVTALLFLSFIAVAVVGTNCTKPPAPTLGATPTPTSAPVPTPIPTHKDSLPLIDAHNHLPRGVSIERVIKLMDEAGVRATTLMPVYYGGNKGQGQGISDENLVLEFYNKQPDRIIPILGMQRPVLLSTNLWTSHDIAAEKLLRFAESKLQTGIFRGVGEFILWHYPYDFPSGPRGGTVKIPADTPLMKRFLDLAARYRVPVIIHYEIDDESFSALKRMLEYGRGATIVLAHGGRADPPTLMAILDEYPNVFCDLGGMTRHGGYGRVSGGQGRWTVKNPIDDGTGHLRREWKALYEQYPDRFMIGTDLAHPEPWVIPGHYKLCIDEFRTLLSDLSPDAAERIGFKNAQKLFGTRSF